MAESLLARFHPVVRGVFRWATRRPSTAATALSAVIGSAAFAMAPHLRRRGAARPSLACPSARSQAALGDDLADATLELGRFQEFLPQLLAGFQAVVQLADPEIEAG